MSILLLSPEVRTDERVLVVSPNSVFSAELFDSFSVSFVSTSLDRDVAME